MFSVSEFRISQLDAVSELEKECFQNAWSSQELASILENPAFHCFVATDGEENVVGYVTLYFVADEADVVNIAVSNGKRLGGCGTQLMTKALCKAKENGIATVYLECRKSNEAAQGLYRKLGFCRNGVRASYYKNPTEDSILMSKKL